MKRNGKQNLRIDWAGTRRIRESMAKRKLVKITINVDAESLAALKNESEHTGMPYQRLLNTLLKEGLSRKRETEHRLDKLEKELSAMKKKLAA